MKTKNWVIAGLLTAGGMIAGAGIEVQAKENKEVFDLPDEDQFLAETSESAVMEESRTDGTEKEEIPEYDGSGDLPGKDGAEETGEKDDTDPVTSEADKDKTTAVEESLENEGSAEFSNGVYEAVVPVQTLTAKAPVSIMASPVSEKNGWNNDRTSYYANGKMVTGEKFIDGYWYHFDAAGNRTSSSFVDLTDNGKTRTVYYNAQGQMLYGQQQLDKDWYCFDLGNGNMFRGLSRLTRAYEPAGEKMVYYDPGTGKMRYGEVQVGGEWRYFLPGWGTMAVNQEITVQNSVSNGGKTARYYYRGDGTKQKGEAKIGNGWKCYDSRTGAMKTGFVDLTKAEYKTNEDKRVYYDRNGYMIYGQQQIDGSWYCFDLGTGKMKTGLTKLSKVYEPAGEKTVYYDPGTGKMQYGVIEVGDRVYTFAQGTGAKQNGTIRSETAEGKRGLIFYGADGLKKTGQQTLNGKWYFFNPENNGFAQTGLYTLTQKYEPAGAKTVYYNNDGTMFYGQRKIEGKWRWFKPGYGSMAVSEFITIPAAYNDGSIKTCYYDGNGNMVYGSRTINGFQYIFEQGTGALLRDVNKLKMEITEYINQGKASGEIWSVALNVLDGSGSFLLNSMSQQSASSIKLFVMGAVYDNYSALSRRYGQNYIDANLRSMITVSDNEAWKYLVSCLGNGNYGTGCKVLTQWCNYNGYEDTYSTGGYGENYTSVRDTANIVSDMYSGKFMYSKSMLSLLKQQTRTWKIPAGLPGGILTGNKTGELTDTENDTAIIFSPRGPYVLSVLSTSIQNVHRAQLMIRTISSKVFSFLNA